MSGVGLVEGGGAVLYIDFLDGWDGVMRFMMGLGTGNGKILCLVGFEVRRRMIVPTYPATLLAHLVAGMQCNANLAHLWLCSCPFPTVAAKELGSGGAGHGFARDQRFEKPTEVHANQHMTSRISKHIGTGYNHPDIG